MENDLYREVKGILNDGRALDKWNEMIVTLIPKVKRLERMKDFKPISLCNVSYKIIARAITNRLRQVMDKIIDQEQSAFVLGRLISDNILIGFKCMH